MRDSLASTCTRSDEPQSKLKAKKSDSSHWIRFSTERGGSSEREKVWFRLSVSGEIIENDIAFVFERRDSKLMGERLRAINYLILRVV